MQRIRIFTCGGTIDKIYFDAGSRYEVGPPNIPGILAELKLNVDFEVQSLLRKDSLEMTDSDRELVRRHVEAATEGRIVITHGTDTMVETAKALHGIEGKTIVFTGSLTPALFRNSDALFNIGAAMTAVQILE
ncbi:MAG: asparaginase domain-containing protein, partial [Pseudohongiellaceae bacterium]